MSTDRVIAYVDGYNLYCGVRSKYGKKYLWLDLQTMLNQIIRPNQAICGIHYCTARTKGHQDGWRRQETYWMALRTIPGLTIHEGFHQKNQKWCSGCRTNYPRFEEKQTDSRIASLMVADAMADRVDTLFLIGGDSDHVPPVQTVGSECPEKSMLVLWPPDRKSNALQAAVGREFYLSETLLRKSQFPDRVSTASGEWVQRPEEWAIPAATK